MFNNKIFRNTQSYLDKVLKKYNLTSGAYPYIFTLEKNEGISQIKISNEIGNDKAMSTRTINKLIENDFIYRQQDEQDSRAYKLYLTKKAKKIIPELHREIDSIIGLITEDLSEKELDITMASLEKIFEKTQVLRKMEGVK
ncbi:MarR family transcriptional regulator [Clostridium bornimense]|uniref:MarR family winged helix-turn-helix transcriptional regulator n=1 Tax=Clostridium bornimense TaxID=1216932 RepID=UPI001C120332|nr:MarR family transcriptional regulator [Clostridium bornimense]MBU5315714.1 MarR family transcriptional regulator [Clostridium bornimense]